VARDSHGCLKFQVLPLIVLFRRQRDKARMNDEPNHLALCRREQTFLLAGIRDDLDLTDHMADAVNRLRIVLAADESIRSHRVVTL
jgi:hypothetical protein